ncbi:MAG: NHL repeat-containing protein [Anaerolineales bacterium]|nr:NHL repeat-containing protein [Anaerolineales bacterium]
MASKNDSPSQPQLFHCPTCGASLPVPDAASVRCVYCGSNVLVPSEYRPKNEPERQAQPVMMNIPSQTVVMTGASSSAGRIFAVIAILTVIGIIGAVALAIGGVFATTAVVDSAIKSVSTQVSTSVAIAIPTVRAPSTATPAPTLTPVPNASLLMKFGGQGNGPGQFDDSRSIALDMDGNIFIANYQDGRIQKFDPSGKYLQTIQVPPDSYDYTIISDMAADYSGKLYVVRSADLLVFNTADGALVKTVPARNRNDIYDKLAVDPLNRLYVLYQVVEQEKIAQLDPEGAVLWTQTDFITQIDKKISVSNLTMAVDGQGNIYLVSNNSYQVFKFNAQGQYVDRFGVQGDGPGKFRSPGSVAVDSKGRVYIYDIDGLEVYDQNGSFVDIIKLESGIGYPFGITFDLQGNFYLVTNQGLVLKYKLNF